MNFFSLAAGIATLPVIAATYIAARSLPGLPLDLNRLRKATSHGFDELIVPEYLISSRPSITINEDGAFTTGFKIRGFDATTQSEAAMRKIVLDLNAVFSSGNEGWMYEMQRVRQPVTVFSDETYLPTATNRVLHDVRKLECYQDESYLLVTYLPPEGIAKSAAHFFLTSENTTEKTIDEHISLGLKALESGCTIIEATLQSCMLEVHRLQGAGSRDELIDVLYKNINGWSLPGIDLPALITDDDSGLLFSPIPLRARLAVQDFMGGLDIKYGDEYIRLLSLETVPQASRPGLLSTLAALAIPMRDHSRMILGHPDDIVREIQIRTNDAADDTKPVGPFESNREIKSASDFEIAKRRISKDALSRMEQLQDVLAEHQSGARKHAWYSRLIEIRSTDKQQLLQWQTAIVETLRAARVGVRVEEAHAVDAWLSTHGGNGYNFVRRTAAHGVTVGDLANVTDAWMGRQHIKCDKCKPGTKPMLWTRRADTLSPFAIDLHAAENDVMSSVVVGPIRFGKTTLVNTIIGHFCKTARDRVIGLDYLRSEERTITMLEGSYGEPGASQSVARLCPFVGIDTIDGRRRAVEWCELVATLNLSKVNDPEGEITSRYTEAIDFLASSPTWREEACVTLFLQKLSAPKAIREIFEHYAEDGIYGHIFDATPAEMHGWQRNIRVYDMTTLHSLSERALFPALNIICADAVRELDGRRTLLVIEEAHIALRHPVMAPWLITLLRTRRKQHLGIIFILTDLEGIDEKILRTLKTLCGTVYATQNPNAHATREAYDFLGFNNRIIDQLIPSLNAKPRRDGILPMKYTYWQLGEDGIAPFVLDLSPAELEVFARGNDTDKERTKHALQRFPHAAPATIFEAADLPQIADQWRNHKSDIDREYTRRMISKPKENTTTFELITHQG